MTSADPAPELVGGKKTAPARRVIPQGNVVILRESELDTDLASAIERVRAVEETRHSRILIIASDDSPEAQGVQGNALPVPDMPTSVMQVARAGGEQALAALAAEQKPLLESLDRFFQETRTVLGEIQEATKEGLADHLPSRLRVARDVLSWMGRVSEGLHAQLADAAEGRVTVDLQSLMQEAQVHVESFFPGLRITVSPAEAEMDCRGRATTLAEACFLALVLTGHRIGGQGAITVEPISDTDHVGFRVVGLGEPAPVQASSALARLRQLVVQDHGGSIRPDAMGPFGTSLRLLLPRSASVILTDLST